MKDVYTLGDLRQWKEPPGEENPPIRLAVLGDPVAHSASPQMHNAALAECGIETRYCRLWIKADELAEAFGLLGPQGLIGVNCTIPHKSEALRLVNRVDDHARRIGVVNTVAVEDGMLVGFNTDGPGFVRALRSEFGVDLRDLRVMILGAGGGAGRAIAMQCGIEQCERLVLVNRTLEKAEHLRNELVDFFSGPRVSGPMDRLEVAPWVDSAIREQIAHVDLVVNCTSIGLKRSDPSPLGSALLAPHLMVYDTVYCSGGTQLVRAAGEAGARASCGLSMLLYQGALAFEIWFNREAPIDIMRAALLAPASAR